MPNNEERLAILETQVEALQDSLLTANTKLDILIDNMNKMKGFWAGAVAAGTALGAALSYLLSHVLNAKIGS